MTFVMATEAQRLISISLAKIAASRCVRGGVSLHKNLLVATVLQKARYIFMEEAFHMVHGTYLNQANSKFIQQLRDQERIEDELRQCERGDLDDDDDASTHSVAPSLDDSDLDIFSTPISSNENLNFLNESTTNASSHSTALTSSREHQLLNKFSTCSKENSNSSLTSTSSSAASPSSSSTTDLIYLDLDINNRVKPQDIDMDDCCSNGTNSSSISGQKRRHCDADFETEEAILSILPKSKQIKLNNNDEDLCVVDHPIDVVSTNQLQLNHQSTSDIISTDNCLSLDFLSSDLSLTSSPPHLIEQPTATAIGSNTMAPLDMSTTSSSSINNSNSTTTNTAVAASSTSASSIDRITSLVSIFNFGNLQRSVSAPDLCSTSTSVESSCCTNLNTQHQIAMTV